MRVPSLIGARSMAIASRSDLAKGGGVIINEHILTASERKPRQRWEPLLPTLEEIQSYGIRHRR